MMDPLTSLIAGSAALALVLAAFWPERGVYPRWKRARRLSETVLREDALKHIYKAWVGGERPSVESVAGSLHLPMNDAADLLSRMDADQLIEFVGERFRLTPRGRESALHIIRAHRLWERYLADRTGYAEEEWHDRAERYEHTVDSAHVEALAQELGNPTHDPHGDPIPTASGTLVSHGGVPLPTQDPDTRLRIVHIEDEPEAVYAQLVAERLHPGMILRLTEVSPQRIRFWADGDEFVLAPILARNISVAPVPEEDAEATEPGERLAVLRPGERGRVVQISRACRGPQRRRLMDLGILAGTPIEAVLTSPAGDPTAYRVRDALIALHRDQANMIRITRIEEGAP